MWTKPIAVLLTCVAQGTTANLFDGDDERIEAPTFSAVKTADATLNLFANKLAACCVDLATGTCHETQKCNKKEKECDKCNKKGGYEWKLPSGDPPSPGPGPGPPPPPPVDTKPCCLVIATNTCHADDKCNQKEKKCLKNNCQKTKVSGASGMATWKVKKNQSPAPTSTPTHAPSNSPTTAEPTAVPTSAAPTSEPTSGPTGTPTTAGPSASPTDGPTNSPTTATPTAVPTNAPTAHPTDAPTAQVSSLCLLFAQLSQERFHCSNNIALLHSLSLYMI